MIAPEEARRLVGRLEDEVNNGGFDQYFFNSASNDASLAIEALEAIGADETAAILKRACSRFPGGMPPADRHERQNALEALDPDIEAFATDDADFFAYKDDLAALLDAYELGVTGTMPPPAAPVRAAGKPGPPDTRPTWDVVRRALIDQPAAALGRDAETITAGSLVQIVRADLEASPAAPRCLAILERDPTRPVRIWVADTAHLLRVYSVRSTYLPDDVLGVPELVKALANTSDDRVVGGVIESDSSVCAMFFDLRWDTLYGAIVGPDRRPSPSRDIREH